MRYVKRPSNSYFLCTQTDLAYPDTGYEKKYLA